VKGARSIAVFTLGVWLGLSLFILATNFDAYFRVPLAEGNDFAVNALQIDNAKHLRELYGHYSRFEFHHPGPAFFYVYAAAEAVLFDGLHVVPAPANAHLLASMFLQTLFFSAALGALAVCFPLRRFALPALSVAAFGTIMMVHFTDNWPPNALPFPFFCFLAASSAFAAGNARLLPVAVVAGGFLLHGHVAQTMFVPPIGAVALSLHVRHSRGSLGPRAWCGFARANKGVLAASSALSALFLLPILVDVASRGGESNAAIILRRFSCGGEQGKSPLQSLVYFLMSATTFDEHDTIVFDLGKETMRFFGDHIPRIAAVAAAIVASPLLVVAFNRLVAEEERRALNSACAIGGVAVALCFAWGMAQIGQPYSFNGYFFRAVHLFSLCIVACVLSCALGRRTPRRPAVVIAATAFCLACVVPAVRTAIRHRPQPALVLDETFASVRAEVDAALRRSPDKTPKLLVFDHPSWNVAAAVGLELTRRGHPFIVAPWWGFMFGEARATAGADGEMDAVTWWIAPTSDEGRPLALGLGLYEEPPLVDPVGAEILFRPSANGLRHVVFGVGPTMNDGVESTARRVELALRPSPAMRDVRVIFDAAAARWEDRSKSVVQSADVSFNGTPLGRVRVGRRASVSLLIRADLWNGRPVAKIDLDFPDAAARSARCRPGFGWWSAWHLFGVRFEIAD